jgi:hypothetical protein
LVDIFKSRRFLCFVMASILFTGETAEAQESTTYFVLLFKSNSIEEAKSVSDRTVDKSRIIKWYDQNVWMVGIGPKSYTDALALQNDIATKTNQKDGTQLIKFKSTYVNTTTGILNASNQIIEQLNSNHAGSLIPNLSITTELPKSPGRPSSTAYEMVVIQSKVTIGKSNDSLLILIFSDGQASVGVNGRYDFFMHQGNGLFASGNSQLIVDEKNNRVSLNGNIFSSVMIVKRPPKKPLDQMTYAEKLQFPPIFSEAKDEIELQAACSSAAKVFSKKTSWYDKKELVGAEVWSYCIDESNKTNDVYLSYKSKWEARFSDDEARKFIDVYYGRCSRDYVIKASDDAYGRRCPNIIVRHPSIAK